MAIGLFYNVTVFAVLVGIAMLRFERKDILS
jgi:ABC-type transport system involved in multi-copper enzyme maturation permease subunit